MKLKNIIGMLSIIGCYGIANAQEGSKESGAKSSTTSLSDRFFMALTTSTYTDMIVSPLKYYYLATGNTDILGNPTYADIPFQTRQFNIISFGFEPRLNLKEFDENSSLSISSPISFGIGSSFSAANDNLIVKGVDGFGSFQAPILLKINIGNGSTYTTQKDFGFSAGGGIEINKIGIINLDEQNRPYNKAFALPCLTAGLTFLRGNSPMEINIKYGFGKIVHQNTDPQGKNLKDSNGIPYIREAKAQSIKLSFIYLLNY